VAAFITNALRTSLGRIISHYRSTGYNRDDEGEAGGLSFK